ncbi:MAG TPA: SEC-C metal-binding domain-containing protein, partial [Fimbriimonadales bacterium]|nr:SEC-C metal-binding domain-containing protein [Fimbriimonadales bacterium]
AKTEEFRKRLAAGLTLEDILPEAFAAVREISRRTLHMRHFDVQILGGIALHQGKIAEMKTGEGKTLVATLPLYLNAIQGNGAHLVTVNDYLARRDAVWMGPIYHTLGLSVGIIQGQSADSDELGGSYIYAPGAQHEDPRYMNLTPCSRRDAYLCDIVYGTNHEFGFDYMRDNMVFDQSDLVMRELNYAIVDEVDSILVDEARTPHIISGASTEPIEKYYRANDAVKKLRGAMEDGPGVHYVVNKKDHSASLTEDGYDKVEELLGIPNLASEPDWMHYINAAVKAHGLFDKDVEYVVKDGQVVLVDENTGRLMFGRRLSEGLHQALEAKEGQGVQRESQTVAVITFQNLFRLYEKLAGMTGTAKTEEDEFRKIYGLEVVIIPTNREMIRTDHPDVIFKTEEAKFRGIARELLRLYTKQQPVLVGTRSIEMSERVSARLTADKLQNLILAERIKHHIENQRGLDKKAKNEAYKDILTPLTDAKQKSFIDAAKSLNLPPDPLGDEIQDWFLEQFDLPAENKQYLDEALRHGIPHKVLNAKYHEREALIVAEAGRKGSITIATNMAGRGVDILLGGRVQNAEIEMAGAQEKSDEDFASDTFVAFRRGGKERAAPPLPLDDQERAQLAKEVVELGGLYILGTERHESRRIDNQLRGRAGRQGDPGESRYFVSLEDNLWKIFNAKMLDNPLLKMWPDLEEVNAKFLSPMIEKTQKRIELHFFEYRKHVLEYDDVLNAQREHIYEMRREYLLGKEARPTVREYVDQEIVDIVERHAPDGIEQREWDYAGIFRDLLQIFPAMDYGSVSELESLRNEEQVLAKVRDWADQAYNAKIAEVGDDFAQVEKIVLLRAITQLWTEHLQSVERLREGIGLRGYGQIDPLIAFRKESHDIFEETLAGIRDHVAQYIYKVQLQQQPAPQVQAPRMERVEDDRPPATNGAVKNGEVDWSKVKRNDLCPCGSGKKFKHCHYGKV